MASQLPPKDVPVYLTCRDRYGVYRPSKPAVLDRGRWWIVSRQGREPLERATTVLAWDFEPVGRVVSPAGLDAISGKGG